MSLNRKSHLVYDERANTDVFEEEDTDAEDERRPYHSTILGPFPIYYPYIAPP